MAGADSMKSYKLLGKIAGVVITDGGGDLLYLQVGVAEQGSGLVCPFLVDKINESHSHILVKKGGEVVCIDGQDFCGILDGEIVCQMLFDICHSQVGQWLQIGVSVFLHQSTVPSDDTAEEIRQLRNIFQLFDFQTDLVG